MTASTSPISIKLDKDMRERIENLAISQKRTTHWMMREAIRQYVEREERHEALKKDVLASWKHFQDTGLHATAEEVEEWIASWGAEDELPMPTCHR